MGVFVFGYGSLMWNPGFRHAGASPALLEGWRRAWCVRSTYYRGCEHVPGVVLGLKRGGCCVGLLFEIPDEFASETLGALDEREMRERGYLRQTLPVLHAGGAAEAIAYTSEKLPDPHEDDIANAYRRARGFAGPTSEYVERTREFIRGMAVPAHWPPAHDGLPKDLSPWETRNACASISQDT
ncbi:gamma-glutamylcyclotransferase [Rhizobium laguerreae]|nr:gamma-glutamylcyclotransferase [Rhizobium laguerreae]